jgi:hypothetical protein
MTCVFVPPRCGLSSCILLLSSVFLDVEFFVISSSCFSLFSFVFLVVDFFFWLSSFYALVVDDVLVSVVS